MIAVAQRTSYPVVPAPRNRFAALTVTDDPGHLSGVDSHLRSLGATAVHQSPQMNTAIPGPVSTNDLCVVDGSVAAIGEELQMLRSSGWRRIVVVVPHADADVVRKIMGKGARSMVVSPAMQEIPTIPTARTSSGTGMANELSDREIQVLQKVADGHSNRQIGADLCLSALTVKSHLARISRKLGTGDRAEMVAIAFRSGLVS